MVYCSECVYHVSKNIAIIHSNHVDIGGGNRVFMTPLKF